MTRTLLRSRNLVLIALFSGLLVVSCDDDVGGPPTPQFANLSLAPSFAAQTSGIVDINRIHIVLTRHSNGLGVLDSVYQVTPGADSVALTLTVTLLESPERFRLTMYFITPTNDTAFVGGPVSVTASTDTPSDAAPVPIDVPTVYVGVGANAVGVSILTTGASVLTGDTVTLNAVALDASGAPIPGTPIGWRSLDSVSAQVPDARSGRVVGGAIRGPVSIVAELLTGLADTASVLVQPVPNAIIVSLGDGQTGEVGTTLPQPITVQLTAPDGLPVEGAGVVFTTTDGGTFSADTVATNSLGAAATTWTLGGGAGTQTTTISVVGATAQATVTATGTPGPAKSIVIVSGDAQLATAGTAVATPPSVRVVDAFGNGVAALPVTFSVTGGGGSITGGAQSTDATGLATVGSWTLGTTAGTNQLTALTDVVPAPPAVSADSGTAAVTVAPVPDSIQQAALVVPASVVFTATGTSGNASFLAKVFGDVQSGVVGTALPDSLIVVATDSNSNPVAGATVAWSVVLGGGTLSTSSTVTDALGRTGVVLTLGTTPGSNFVRAVLAGRDSVDFTEQADVGPPAQLAFLTQPPNSVAAGAVFGAAVEVQDSFGNAIPTDSTTVITVAITTGTGTVGANLTGTATQTTGFGSVTYTDLAIDSVGIAYQLDATAPGLTSATSTAFNVTASLAPIVATDTVSSIVATGFRMKGDVNPNGLTTDAWFEFGTDAALASFTATPTQAIGSGTVSLQISATVTGLTPATTYFYRVAASNGSGTRRGAIRSTATLQPLAGVRWVNPVSGNWSTAANWSTGVVPDSTDDVFITVDGTYTVTLNIGAKVKSLTVGGVTGTQTLAFLPFLALTIDSAGTVGPNGVIDHSTSTIDGLGTLSVSGTYNWLGGVQAGTGTTRIESTGTLNISPTSNISLNSRTLDNLGTAVWDAAGTSTMLVNGGIINNSGAFAVQANALMDFAGLPGAAFNNSGTFTRSVGTGTFTIDIAFNNTGTVNVNSGTLKLTRGGTTTAGTFNVPLGTTLGFGGGTQTVDVTSNISGAGNVTFSGGTTTVNGGYSITGTGTTTVSNGIVNFSNLATPSTTVNLTQTGGTVGGTGTLTVAGAGNWSGGTMSGGGLTTILSGATLTGSGTGTKILDNRLLVIGGSTVWSGTGQLQLRNNAVVNILTGGLWDMQTDADFGQFSAGTANVQNNGIFRKSAGTGVTSFSIPFTNASGGTLDVQTGQVQFPNTGNTLGGTVTIASGAEVQVTGGTTTLPAGQVLAPSPAGLLRMTSGTLTLGGASLADTVKLGRFISSGGTLTGAGVLLATDTITWTNNFWGGTGKTVIPTGVILIGSGSSGKTIDTRDLDIAGTAEWSGAGQLQLRNNAVVNILTGGLWDMRTDADFGQFSAGTANVQNNGIFRKSAGTGVTSFSIPFTNASGGKLDVQTGQVQFPNTGNTLGGTVTIANGAEVQITGGTTTLPAGQVLAPSPAGLLRMTSGTLTLGGASLADTVKLGRFISSGGTLTGAGVLLATDTITWTNNFWGGTGKTVIPTGVILIGSTTSSKTLDTRTLDIAGTAEWSGAGQLQLRNNAVVNILTGGLFDIQTDADFGQFSAGTANVQNNGIFRKSAGTGVTSFSIPFTNASGGTLDVQTGQVQFPNTGNTLGGTVTIASGAEVQVTGGTTTLPAGQVLAPSPAGLLRMTSGTLTLGGASLADTVKLGRFISSGGTLTGAGVLLATDTITWTNNFWGGTGKTLIPTGVILIGGSASAKTIDTRTLDIAGTAEWSGTGQLQLRNNAVVNILTGGLWDMRTDADFGQFSAGTANVQNNGIFRKSAGTGVTSFSIPFTNASGGTLDVQTGQVQFPNTGNTLGGTVTIANGAEVQITGGTTTIAAGRVLAPSPAGLLRMTSGTLTLGGASLADTVKLGRFIMSGGTVDGASVLLATDTITWTNSFWGGTGKTLIPTGVILIGSSASGKTLDARTLDVVGTVEWSGSGQLQLRNNAVVNILTGGLFDMQTDADFGAFSPGTANVQNNGTFRKSGGTGVTSFSIPFTNASGGTLNVQTGQVQLPSAGNSLDGTVTIANGAEVQVTGGTTTLPVGQVLAPSPAGLLRLTGGTMTLGGASLADTVKLGRFIMSGGTLNGGGVLLATDTVTWTNSFWSGSGKTLIPTGVILIGSSASGKTLDARTLDVVGTVEWSGSGQLQLRNNAVVNILTGGLFDMQTDADFGAFSPGTANVQNNGTFRKSGGTGVTSFSIPFTNASGAILNILSGTVDINSTFSNLSGASPAVIEGVGSIDLVGATVSVWNGIIRPGGAGAAGTLTIVGDLPAPVNATPTIQIEIGPTAGINDQLVVTGIANFSGTLDMSTLLGASPATGAQFTVMTFASSTGSFSVVQPAGNFTTTFNLTNIILEAL